MEILVLFEFIVATTFADMSVYVSLIYNDQGCCPKTVNILSLIGPISVLTVYLSFKMNIIYSKDILCTNLVTSCDGI